MKPVGFVILSILVFVIVVYAVVKKSIGHAAVVDTSLDNSINLAMSYLSKSTLPTGRFVYYANVDTTKKYNQKLYNALRHAGTLYSMYLCERYYGDDSLKEKRLLASKYLIDNYVKKVGENMYAVVSKVEEEGGDAATAKLGGAGLALLGLSNLYPEGKVDLKVIQGLGNFIVYLQNPDGSYYSKFDVENSKKDGSFNSLYYPGEAAYGLLFLNEVDPNVKWVNSAKKALIYIANTNKNKSDKEKDKMPFDHWTLLATKKLFETPNNGLTSDEKHLLQQHAELMANLILDTQIIDDGAPYLGGYIDNLGLCSIGTRMEGLVAVYAVIEDTKMKEKVYRALTLGTEFLSQFQVKEGEMAGAIPTNAHWRLSNAPEKNKVIRIDNVQHVISAWITFKALQK